MIVGDLSMGGKIKTLGFHAVSTGPEELGALQKATVAKYA